MDHGFISFITTTIFFFFRVIISHKNSISAVYHFLTPLASVVQHHRTKLICEPHLAEHPLVRRRVQIQRAKALLDIVHVAVFARVSPPLAAIYVNIVVVITAAIISATIALPFHILIIILSRLTF